MTTWFPTEDPVPAVETWAEARYAQISGGEKIPLITIVALISLAFGVSGPGELLLGSGGMLDGLDGIISLLSGVQLAKKKYATMAFPAILESYKLFKDVRSGQVVNKQSVTRSAIFVTGWLAARYKYV
jgi:hypothetical protein